MLQPAHRPRLHRIAGFTLIEIAIVLVVIGLLLSGGLLAISPVVQQAKISETRSKIALVESAIQTHLIVNGCIPCPATGNLAVGNADVGRAVDDAAYATGCANVDCIAFGVVPWVNLGLSEANVTDAFGNRLGYAASNAMADANSIRSGSTYPAGDLTVNDAAGNAITTAAAYVLLSHGPDGSNAFAATTGTQQTDRYGSAQQNENTNSDTVFIQRDSITANNANYFDDIVVFKTAPNLIQGCGAGSCGNPE